MPVQPRVSELLGQGEGSLADRYRLRISSQAAERGDGTCQYLGQSRAIAHLLGEACSFTHVFEDAIVSP
jgi:hypothetical protein